MLKTFNLDGLDCAHCAAKIEAGLAALDGVISVNVSFLAARLDLEVDDSRADEIFAEAKKLVTKLDDDVTVCD